MTRASRCAALVAALLTGAAATSGHAQTPGAQPPGAQPPGAQMPGDAPSAETGPSAVDLAKDLANPIADLISIPFQVNYDGQIGADDGWRLTTNVQPVVPIRLTPDWIVISRTIVPIVYQADVRPGAGSRFGLGDAVQSLFLSPTQPAFGRLTWGVGPVFLVPTATDTSLGGEQWGAGPTAVGLMQEGPWTVGALANHVWSFAGDDDRADVNRTFVQPFVSYTTPAAWTYTLQSETTYDWEAEVWSVPVNALVGKLTRIGDVAISLQLGAGYWVESPDGGPEGFRARAQVTILLPQ